MKEWHERDLPILKAFAAAEGRKQTMTAATASEVGLDLGDVWTGLQALRDAGFLTWGQQTNAAYGQNRVLIAPRLLERGRVQLEQWPDSSYDTLVAVLEARIAETTDSEERGRLERFRVALLGMGRDVATSLITKFLEGLVGR